MSIVTDSSRPPAPMLFSVMRPLSAFCSLEVSAGGASLTLRLGLLLCLGVLDGGDRAPSSVPSPEGGGARLERADALLLGLVAGQRDRPLVLGLDQVALDLLLDEMRELAVAGVA